MTKVQLKEKYTEWNKNISALDDRKTKIFHELQELCFEKGDGNKWCGIEKLAEELIKRGQTIKTMQLLSEYYKICGKEPKRQGATATSRQDRSATCFLTRASQ